MQDLDATIRALMSRVIRRSTKKREQIAAEMTARLGQHITERMLNDYTAQSKRALRFPAAWVPAFCEIVGSDELQRRLLGPELRKLLELGEKVAALSARKGLLKGED